MNETLKVLRERRSIRKYEARQIDPAALDAILEAGTWAPSGMGRQPVVMVAIQDPDTLAVLSRVNAEIMGAPGTDPFYGAPTAVAVLADGGAATWLQDGSLTMGYLMTAAASLGIGSCWINRAMETFERPEGKALLQRWGLPDTLRGVGFCLLGYADGEPPQPKPRKAGAIVRP